jgi:hypothetical protein
VRKQTRSWSRGKRFESARRLSYCADLQGKRRSTPKFRHGIGAAVLQPILQRSFYGSGCPVLKGWVIDFWVTFSGVILIVRRYIRERPTSLEGRSERWCKKLR